MLEPDSAQDQVEYGSKKGHKAGILSQRRGAIDIEAIRAALIRDGRRSLVCDRRRRRQDSLGIAAAGATEREPDGAVICLTSLPDRVGRVGWGASRPRFALGKGRW